MMAARKASRRSTTRVAKVMENTRTMIGAASTTPIMPASSPLAFSQTGKNGSWIPKTTNMAA